MIDARWYILEAVAPGAGAEPGPSAPRWQMAPAAGQIAGDQGPGGHRLVPPATRLPLREPPEGTSASEVIFALALEGVVETSGMSRRSAARLCMNWTGLDEISDEQAAETAAEAAEICRSLGVTD